MRKRTFNFQPAAIELQKKVVDMNPESSSRRESNGDDLVDFPYPADFKKGYYFIPRKLKATNNSISKLKREQKLNDYLEPDGQDFGLVTGEDDPFAKPISAILSGINSSIIRTPKVLGYTTKIKNEKKMKKRFVDDKSLQSAYPTFLVSPTQPNKQNPVDLIRQSIEESRKKLGIGQSTKKADPKINYSISINTKLDSPRKSLMGHSKSHKSLHTKNYGSISASIENNPKKLGSFAMSGTHHSNTSSLIIPTMHSRKPTKGIVELDNEVKAIREANQKIKNTIQAGSSMRQSMSCENLKKILLNQASYFHSPKAVPVAMESERAPILILFDQELMFIKDHMEDLRYSLKLVFDKVDSYEFLIQKDKQIDLTKKNQLLSYFCVFMFLKCEPFATKTSSKIFNEMTKKNTCYLVRCSSGEKTEEVEGETDGIRLSQRSSSMQHSLTLGYNKFKTHFVPYEEYQNLQNFIVSRSKVFDESRKNSVVR